MSIRTIGILGAGKLGVVLSQLALAAGYKVLVAGSGDPQKIALSFSVLAPGTKADWSRQVAAQADLVILALPLSKYTSIPKDALSGKLVIDAMNHWWEVDGDRDSFLAADQSSSSAVDKFLERARVVKAFNHMGYHDLHDESRPTGAPGRKAIAVAGDNQDDVRVVMQLVDHLGFDPVHIGDLATGRKLEPGHPAFGANVVADKLTTMIRQDQTK